MVANTAQTRTEKELSKALSREQVAGRKLERLKDRYDKLLAASTIRLSRCDEEKAQLQASLAEQRLEAADALARCAALQDEAAMWKSQLFEQLDRLEDQQLAYEQSQYELALAQEALAQAPAEVVPGPAEVALFEQAIAENRAEIGALETSLVAARARVDGLKNLGTCLTAKLGREIAQTKALKQENVRLEEQALELAELLAAKDAEVSAGREELFEARKQILALRLESGSWDLLKAGLAPQREAVVTPAAESDGAFPEYRQLRQIRLAPGVEVSLAPKYLLQRASKTVGGWFKLGSKSP